jgi:hypothetical protein
MRLRRRLANVLTHGLAFQGYSWSWLAGQLALASGLSLVATTLVELMLFPSGRYLSYGQLWLILTAGLLVQWFGRTVAEAPAAGEVAPETASTAELPARSYPIAHRWERRLSVTSGDPEWFGRVARDRLTGLVAARLRQRHGHATLDRATLGDELHEFLTAPVTRTPSPAELGRLISRMEQL